MKFLPFLFLLFLTSCSNAQSTSLEPIEFQKAITETTVQVLDVRTTEEFNLGYIDGAIQADWNKTKEFQKRVKSLDKKEPVYIYCQSGRRSAAAQEWMLANGFKEVINLTGGMNAWLEAGLDTTLPSIH